MLIHQYKEEKKSYQTIFIHENLDFLIKYASRGICVQRSQMCFTLVDVLTLMPDELKKVVEAIILLTQKQNGTVKG